MIPIKVGDVVQLKSGGLKMTVSQIGNAREVLTAWCDWFDDTKQHHDAFPVHSLKPAA
jgi:uncharacterized protein YodC (DUF2158 family)